ncbi:hypothetical protein DESUT3_29490 [Desulfuromonas versatilis]|uniref:DUF4197 domain-containing protein n=1 Tax=Desulfuromonas versatilis TaxID=2802975 RepID=A0ABN6E0M8_9BACT|nr:DUF4197 domain-containing protein [Desulfuromonas versatilis]BCR05880.1 hypothetical protein DESUT3_29490 [Desulfuromonas versatilis]
MRRQITACLVLCSLMLSSCGGSPVDRLKNGVNALGEQATALGLKRAMGVGVREVVNRLGQVGGYLDNPLVRLVVPPPFLLAADLLRMGGTLVQKDPVEAGLNLAAERAAPLAGPILLAALEQTSVPTMRELLNAGETAATDYLRKQTEGKLVEVFQPAISATLAETGALEQYRKVMEGAKDLQPAEQPAEGTVAEPAVSLEQYATTQAIDGLFKLLGSEEQRIRQGPEFGDLGLLPGK